MKEDKFIKDNAEIWKELEHTLKKLRAKGLKRFDRNELDMFITNYNRTCGHLSYCRTYFGNTATADYLNRLVASAHSYIYTTKSSTLKNLYKFFFMEFPRLLRSNSKFFALSTAFFCLGIALSFIYTLISPENAAAFLPKAILDNIDFGNNSSANWNGPIESSFILTNNIRVGFYAFALGITLGIGTSVVLVYNGFILGTLASLAMSKGFSLWFWSLILPHGVLELFAIFVCGAAGLSIGYAFINPGLYSRRDSLILKGKTAIKLVCGTIPIFTVAGFIEGFITPSALPQLAKLGFALFTLLLLLFWLLFPVFRQMYRDRQNTTFS